MKNILSNGSNALRNHPQKLLGITLEFGTLKNLHLFLFKAAKSMSKFCVITTALDCFTKTTMRASRSREFQWQMFIFLLLFSISTNFLPLLHFCSFLHHFILALAQNSTDPVENTRQY